MPPHLQAQDTRLRAAQQLLDELDAEVDVSLSDIEVGLALFLQEDFSPITHAEAIPFILRDWLVGHGYLPPVPVIEEQN